MPIVVFPKRLRAGSVVTIEIPDPPKGLRSAALHRLIFRNQKSPFLQIIAFNRPVKAVVAHRILLSNKTDSITELLNIHICEERWRRSNPAFQFTSRRMSDPYGSPGDATIVRTDARSRAPHHEDAYSPPPN